MINILTNSQLINLKKPQFRTRNSKQTLMRVTTMILNEMKVLCLMTNNQKGESVKYLMIANPRLRKKNLLIKSQLNQLQKMKIFSA